MGGHQCLGSWAGRPQPNQVRDTLGSHLLLPGHLCFAQCPAAPQITRLIIQPWLPKSAAICHTTVFTSPPAPPFSAQVSPACVVEVQASLRSNCGGSRPLGMRSFFFFFSNPLEKQMLWLIFIIPTLIYFNCSGYPEYYDCIISCICL